MTSLAQIEKRIPKCTRCPELRAYCADVAATKRSAYRDEKYWGRPVPSFGDRTAKIVIIGLAPGAHGANRTGRIFTGDRSGDFLYGALHRVGLANQPTSVSRDDGLELRGVYITMPVRCAPPANKPTAEQRDRCAPYLVEELKILAPRAILALGGIGFQAALRALAEAGIALPRPRPKFGHGVHHDLGTVSIFGCYHVSQQNTFTGRLTEDMLDDVLRRVIAIADALASKEHPCGSS